MNDGQWIQGHGESGPADGHTDTSPLPRKKRKKWPLYVIGAGASVTIWGGWVGLGAMTGFGRVKLLPGIWDSAHVNTSITLPLGMEAYAVYAFGTWLDSSVPKRARSFAMWSAFTSSALGMVGQAIYHDLVASHRKAAPSWVTLAVACLPVLAALFGAILHTLQDAEDDEPEARGENERATMPAPHAEVVPEVSAPVPSATPLPGSIEEPLALPAAPVSTEPVPSPVQATEPPLPSEGGYPSPPMDGTPSAEGTPAAETEPAPPPSPSPAPVKPRAARSALPPGDRPVHTVGTRRVTLRDVGELLPRAKEINEAWRSEHDGRDIGCEKLSKQMRIHKGTASALLKVIKAERNGDTEQAVNQ